MTRFLKAYPDIRLEVIVEDDREVSPEKLPDDANERGVHKFDEFCCEERWSRPLTDEARFSASPGLTRWVGSLLRTNAGGIIAVDPRGVMLV